MLSTQEKYISQEIIETCQKLHSKNLLAAADGNVSVRLSEDRILMTPSGKPKSFIHPEDMAILTLSGQVLQGNPSSERKMHLKVFQSCPEAQAVIHAHPPTAVALSIARPQWKEVPCESFAELILAMGSLPIAPYARSGTSEMAEVLHPYLQDGARAMILQRHGALTWGESLMEAYMGMERIEHICEVLMKAELLGGATPLPESEIKELYKLRSQLGPRLL
jgi:L-fuculose-phosphate aldolase